MAAWGVNDVLHRKQLADRRWHKLLVPYFLLLSYTYTVVALWKRRVLGSEASTLSPSFAIHWLCDLGESSLHLSQAQVLHL